MALKVYEERSGDPRLDNHARRKNRMLRKVCERFVVTTPQGRRRKKQIKSVEWPKYVRLVAEIAEDMYRKKIEESK